ncbi:MAG TPA: hypothetical protein VGM05_09345 [Planctomycetaceae bacterium]
MKVSRTALQRWGSLAAAILSIGFVWLVVLPRLAAQHSVSEYIANQQRLGIDASAMFYSELEIVPAIAHHVERLHDAHGDDFWNRASPDPPN